MKRVLRQLRKPSRETLLAMFAGLLTALPRNFAYGLKALIDKKEAETV